MRLVDDDWLTQDEVAERLRVSVSWLTQSRAKVRRALEFGRPRPEGAPPFIELGKSVRYPASQLEEFLNSIIK